MMKRVLDKTKAPLYEALVAHVGSGSRSFHIPGHKSGQGLASSAASFLKQVMSIDLTEITGLDDLHRPDGVIDDAQSLAADCFGALHTFFLVGGSTVGNIAMIVSMCKKQEVWIVQRNSHQSILNGLRIAAVNTVFITPSWQNTAPYFAPLTLNDVEQAFQCYPQARGIILTNPDYYGRSVELSQIVAIAHKMGKFVFVDEAHGAHLAFHSQLPASALACGADMVVQSTHKMLNSLTMGALLHIGSPQVDIEHVKKSLALFQSSSPSYPIMASIDLTRMQMHNEGMKIMERGIQLVEGFSAQIKRDFPWFGQFQQSPDVKSNHQDLFKIWLSDLTCTLTGHKLREQLEFHQCFVELSNEDFVLLVFTSSSNESDTLKLIQALTVITQQFSLQKKELLRLSSNKYLFHYPSQISRPVQMNTDTLFSSNLPKKREVQISEIDQAIGQIIAEDIVPYPPGIPICFSGEFITPQLADYMQTMISQGAQIKRTPTNSTNTIHIFA